LGRYDVFVFGFGSSLMHRNLDLPVLRAFGKTVVSNIAHGSEARPPYIDATHQAHDGTPLGGLAFFRASARRIARRVRRIERYSSVVIGAPYSSQFCTRPMINLFSLGLPFSSAETEPETRAPSPAREPVADGPAPDGAVRAEPMAVARRAVRVLHAPSHPAAKGSDIIRATIESLQAEGYAIDFVELRGRPNAEVVSEIRACDFVIDQLYSDTPLAGLATEAAYFGKPSVVGGYRIRELERYFERHPFPPSHLCHPSGLEEAVRLLLDDPAYRRELGAAAQRFVREHWSPEAVAARFLRVIDGDAPDDWWFDPRDVTYLEGFGSVERSRAVVRELVAAHGVGALELAHRPDLERAFVAFAEAPRT
jgi:hypothetical protein